MRNHHIDCGIMSYVKCLPGGLEIFTFAGDPNYFTEEKVCTCTAFDHVCPIPQLKHRKTERDWFRFIINMDVV